MSFLYFWETKDEKALKKQLQELQAAKKQAEKISEEANGKVGQLQADLKQALEPTLKNLNQAASKYGKKVVDQAVGTGAEVVAGLRSKIRETFNEKGSNVVKSVLSFSKTLLGSKKKPNGDQPNP